MRKWRTVVARCLAVVALQFLGLCFDAGPALCRDARPLGIGLAGIADWSTAMPFLDLMKSSRDWVPQAQGAPWGEGGELDLDADGWVTSLASGQWADRFVWTNILGIPMPFSRLVVRWKGTGTIDYPLGLVRVAAESGERRDVVQADPNSDYLVLSLTATDPNDPVREITVTPEEYDSRLVAGEMFNPVWLGILAPFRAVRFMDWMMTNTDGARNWGERPRPEQAAWAGAGVPVEVMVRLANTLLADPWFNMPHRADDDYVRRFARYVRDHLDPRLVAHVEHSNEVWNWGFPQSHYANEMGRARWTPTGDPEDAPGDSFIQWHGMRTAVICDIWKKEVFVGQTGRVRCELGVQTGWKGLEEGALECPAWVAEGNEACWRHGIDSIAVTTYFSGGVNGGDCNEATVRSWMAQPDGGLATAMEQLRAGGLLTPCSEWEDTGSVAELADDFAYFKSVADRYGLTMTAYEGGQHITGNGHATQDDPDFIAFHVALNRDKRMTARYREMLSQWRAGGGTLLMHFVEAGSYDKWGSWGALEYPAQGSSPKYDALREFGLTTACWWPGCIRDVPGPWGLGAPTGAMGLLLGQ